MRENHYAISCIVLKISYVFNKQDEHNASYFSKMSWTDNSQSKYKIIKKTWNTKVFCPENLQVTEKKY